MKKLVLSLAALACAGMVNAQELGGYTASHKQNIALEGATVVNTGFAASDLDGCSVLKDGSAANRKKLTGTGFPIGFDFPFNGKTMKYFGIGTDGAVKLSETEEVTMYMQDVVYNASSANGGDDIIFFYDTKSASYEPGNELGYDTLTISYKTINDNELVVEFKNVGINTSSWSTNLYGTYTSQIHLYKDGTIKYVVAGLSDLPVTNAGQVYLGLRGNYGEYLTWNDGLAATNKVWANGRNFNLSQVPDGYCITLNTPQEIQHPVNQPTDLVCKVNYSTNSIQANATFTSSDADMYLMTISKGAPTEEPVDGTVYAEKDSIGNAYIMRAGVNDQYAKYSNYLEHDTEYTITVYGYNAFGKGGVKYNRIEPLQYTFTTAPQKPASLKVTATTKNSISLIAAPCEGNRVFVAVSDSTFNPGNYGARGFIGTPVADAQVGDVLYNHLDLSNGKEVDTLSMAAGKVVYFGDVNETGEVTLEGLESGKSYYFQAVSYNPVTGQFSQGADTLQAWTSTNIVAPYTMDLTAAPDMKSLGGWSRNIDAYEYGFMVNRAGRGNVDSQTEGNRVYSCQNMDNTMTYYLQSPVIEVSENNKLSLDWHIHAKGGFRGMYSVAYEEWCEDDSLAFVAVVDGKDVILKKYTYANAPVDENETTWHSETFDLSQYAGKNIQFAIRWLGANSSTLLLGMENLKITADGSATAISAIEETATSSNGAIYNLAGQKVNKTSRGVIVQDSKKFVNK